MFSVHFVPTYHYLVIDSKQHKLLDKPPHQFKKSQFKLQISERFVLFANNLRISLIVYNVVNTYLRGAQHGLIPFIPKAQEPIFILYSIKCL